MENILELAKKAAEAAEVFTVNLEETSVHFESNRLKNVQGKQSTTITLRVIKNGRVGYASASGEVNAASLVDMAEFLLNSNSLLIRNTTTSSCLTMTFRMSLLRRWSAWVKNSSLP